MGSNVHLKEGDILNERYRIISHLNSGGMSTVYVAEDIQTGNRWAVKASFLNEKWSRQLISEAQMLSEMAHPNLPKIADFFSSERRDYFYLVQELIDGQTLKDLFEEKKHRLPVPLIIDVAVQLCALLEYLHERNIIYRDLKPGNVMIERNGQVKLIDFGIARKYDVEKFNDTVQIGTVGFAAPEQFEKMQTDHRTDLFSLGALMYFLLSGGKYVYTTRKPLNRLHKGLPKKLVQCVKSLTQLEPERRCQSAAKAKRILEDIKKKQVHPLNSKGLRVKYLISFVLLIGVLLYIGIDSGIL